MPGNHFCYRLSRPQDHSLSLWKTSKTPVESQTRDFPGLWPCAWTKCATACPVLCRVKFALEHAMKVTSTLDGGGWLTPRPARFALGKETRTRCVRGWLGHRPGLDRCWKFHPHRDSVPEPSSYTDCAIAALWIEYPIRIRLLRIQENQGSSLCKGLFVVCFVPHSILIFFTSKCFLTSTKFFRKNYFPIGIRAVCLAEST
jgi:hypothetical protein